MIIDKNDRKDKIKDFVKSLKDKEKIVEFDNNLWCSLINEIIVHKMGEK